MDYRKFKFTNTDCIITRLRATFERKEGAKSFSRVPISTKDYGIVGINVYNNFVTSIPFFNNWGDKAYCRANWEDTSAGYLPVEIVTVSPDGNTKHIDRFYPVSFPRYAAELEAGFRERDCMDNAVRYEFYRDGEHRLFTFYHKDGEHAATFDTLTMKWTN